MTPEQLAIEGGQPVRPTFLPYAHQVIDDDDVAAVTDALRSDWLTTGPRVDELERAFAEFVGARHAIAFSSGTAALHGCTFALGIGSGDEVVVPALTFAATAACVAYQGGRPVLCDVRPDTLNLDPADVERRLTARTKAIIAVHYAGVPAAMEEISAIASRAGVAVVEDSAHALGARIDGRACGTLGALGVFSLHPAKQMTAGEGGIATTDDASLAERLRRFRNHCMDTSGRERETKGAYAYRIEELGYNYRLTDIQAALGRSQLAKLPRFLETRRSLADLYANRLADLDLLELPTVPAATEPAWHLFVVKLQLERLRADRDAVFAALRAENIGVNVHYIPVHFLGYYGRLLGHGPGDFPAAEDAFSRLLTLPLHAAMTAADVDDVAAALEKVLGSYRA